MTLLVRTRATIDGVERDLLVEVKELQIMPTDDGRAAVLLDDYAIFADPGADPGTDPGAELAPVDAGLERDDVASAAEIVIEGVIVR